MNKRIEFKESALANMKTSDVTRLSNKVKAEKGSVGSTGKLTDNIFFRVVRNGFIIF